MKHFLLILVLLPATAFAGGGFFKPFIKSGAKTLKSSADDIASVVGKNEFSKYRGWTGFYIGGEKLTGNEYALTSDLWYALWHSREKKLDEGFIRDLIAGGANVNATANSMGGPSTMLHASITTKHKNITKILIEEGADVNAKDKEGITPLMYAANVGDIETFKMLIDAGADVSAVSKDNLDVLDFAIRSDHRLGTDIEAFRVLIEEAKKRKKSIFDIVWLPAL